MEYYYLVAGLAEQSFDEGVSAHADALVELREQIQSELSAKDASAVKLLYTYYDIQNVVGYATHSSLPFNRLGNLSPEQVARMVDGNSQVDPDLESIEAQIDSRMIREAVPTELMLVIDRFKGRNSQESEEFEPLSIEQLERELYSEFYRACLRSKVPYLRQWSNLDRQIRNITAAYKARAMKLDAGEMIVEQGELREQFINSTATDFGMREIFPYMDQLLTVLDTADFVERERRMDMLRWEIADELAERDYFGIGAILCYMIHINIRYRWASLDKEQGRVRFKDIVNKLVVKKAE